jgi:hypothetical protein
MKSFCDLLHQLLFVLSVHTLDLRILQRFLPHFEDSHVLQIFPIHTNSSGVNVFDFREGEFSHKKAQTPQKLSCDVCASWWLSEFDAVDDVFKSAAVSIEFILRSDRDEVVDLSIGRHRRNNPIGLAGA